MKLLHLTGSLSRDGGGVHSALLGLLPAQQTTIPALALHGLVDGHWALDRDGWGRVPVRAHSIRGPAVFGYAPTMRAAALDAAPDLIHCHGLWRYPSLVSEQVSRRHRRPRVVSAHGMLNAEPLAVGAWRKRIAVLAYEGRHVRGASLLHALTGDEARSIRRFGYHGPIAVLPNGVALGDADGSTPGLPPWSDRLPATTRVLLFLGRKDPIKNLPTLLAAWKRLAAHGSLPEDWALVIAGWGDPDHAAELEQRIAVERLPRVILLGPLYGEDKRRALGAASAFVLVSKSEAMPMAALEAAAWRLPLLLTPECRLPQASASGAAITVTGDEDGIAAGLADLMGLSDGSRHEMGERGRVLVEGTFGWDRIAARFLEAYQWLLGGGTPPAFVETE